MQKTKIRWSSFLPAVALLTFVPLTFTNCSSGYQAYVSNHYSQDPSPGNDSDSEAGVPLSFDDSRFSANTVAANALQLSNGEVAENLTWDSNNISYSVGGGDFTLKNSRIRSNEGIRVFGTSGHGGIVLDGVYAESEGLPGDHADTLQCYSPGGTNTFVARNTMFRAHTSDATAGFFVADDFAGSFTFENVVFWGGPYGLRMHADGNTLTISLKDVYFVGPFGYDALLIDPNMGGTINIVKWENVREATIVNGQIVPGNLIPQP